MRKLTIALVGALAVGLVGAVVVSAGKAPPGIPAFGTARCDAVVSTAMRPSSDRSVIDKRVAVWPRDRVLQTIYFSSYRPFRWWAKQGVEVRSGTARVEIAVPTRWRDRLSIGWGGAGAAEGASVVRFQSCRTMGGGAWRGYAGGFYARRRGCFPLLVQIGPHRTRVLVALGKPC